ncbi:CHAT domain-containing protein [Ancylothrix sp. C2]|uniref:CHAT domain-containing protein n=1 Tax=Ancylothrix sp. D3o TaxID=2953691 RepID=UPI0021BA9FAC|nr:CHAT domain-containing tetratricopeptide repeat protein [Ancylothrix sp. D3o]MCT7953162.1 CHAT domain-containing protein [Ancylothrix sp. D3o]
MDNAKNTKKRVLELAKKVSLSGTMVIVFLAEPAMATPKLLRPVVEESFGGVLISQGPIDSNTAKQVFQEGFQLLQQGTAESLRQAIPKFEEAARLYRQAGDKRLEAVSLVSIGYIYNSFGERHKALEFYNQALPLFRAVGDRSMEATTLNNIGLAYDSLGEKQKALEFYNQALPLRRAVGDKRGEATTLNNLGNLYNLLGEKQEALEFYNQALPLFRALGDRRGEATTLNNLGNLYDSLGEKQRALEFCNQALALFRAVGDRRGEATTLTGIAQIYDSLGEKQKALEFYNQALPVLRVVGDRGVEATTLTGIAQVYDSLGEKQKALEFYNQALPVLRVVGDRRGEAITLTGIGLVYDSWGEKPKALEYYNQALPIRRALGDRRGEATTLNNLGNLYNSLGEKQKALEFYNQALPLLQAVGDRRGEATTLNNLGYLYYSLGEKQKALEYYNQALPLLRAVGDKRGEATTLNNIGALYDSLREKQKALEFYNQALPLRQGVGDRRGEATTLNNIGALYDFLGEKQKALEFYNQALPLLRAAGDRLMEATILNNFGNVYDSLGQKQKALEFYNQALPLRRAVGDREGEANTLYNLAYLERDRGNLNTALTQIESTITIIEDLRTKIGSQELRASYFAAVQNYYQFYIDVLMQLHQQNPSQGYDAHAFHASERARARSLLELLTEASADIRQGVDPKLLEQEQILQQQLNTFDYQKYQLLSNQHTQQQLDEIQQQINSVLTQLDQLKAEIRTSSPRYADLKYPQPLNLQEIQQQVLDDDTLLLEYALGEDRSFLWLISKNSITSYVLPPRSEIETAAQAFRQSLTSSAAKLESGLPLSQIILAPVASQIANKRLLIVGDGVLQSVPFAALPLPNSSTTPLLVQNEIITLPSASTVAIQRQQLQNRPAAAKTIAVLADPIFTANDPRLSNIATQPTPETLNNLAQTRASRNLGLGDSATVFDRLPNTRIEAQKILTLVPNTERLEALDFDASLAKATDPNLAQYQIVHLATHGLVDPVNPELSGIVLSLFDRQGKSLDGFLRLHDIFNLNLPAELVVLSACETGLGENVKGEGLVGLTRGFMYAGAKRVVVSLWSVNDVATSELMVKFYHKILQEKQNPVTALREAQLEMWNSGQWRSPYYWAAFTIQGDWQ